MVSLHRIRLQTLALLGFVGVLAVALPAAHAQMMLNQDEDMIELEYELLQLHEQLEIIQRTALDNNPELRDQAGALGELMVAAMEEEGYAPQESIDRIQEIQLRLQETDLDPDDRLQLMEEAQSEYLRLEQGQAAALERDDVHAAHQQFQEDVVQAMQNENPDTAEILDEFTRKQQEYEEQLAAAPYTDAAFK